MKIISAQGHFGTMDGRVIRFEDGLNVLYLPNEGGKTTLCDFIRVMLYGLNTSKRDSKQQLSDKTRYRPVDGSPMSGLLELEWKGRRIVLSRQTGKGGPMQEFSAHYADTGEECSELTSKDCGEMLTGVGEEGFRSSAMIDGMNQAVSAKELGDRILALSTTGDSAMMYSRAVEQLDKWRSQLKGGSHGRLAQVEEERGQLAEAMTHLDELDEEIRGYEQRVPEAEQIVQDCEAEYQQTYEEFMVLFAGKREEAERSERKAREAAAHLKQQLPDLKKLKNAEDAVAAYEKACEDLKREQENYEDINQNYTDYRSQIDKTEQEYDNSEWGTSDIHVRWWALAIAVVFVLAAAAGFLKLLPFPGMIGTVIPYVFTALAVIFLIVSYFNSSQSLEKPPMDFDQERKKLDKRKAQSSGRIVQAEEKMEQAEQWMQNAATALHIPDGDMMQIAAEIAELIALREAYIEHKQLHETLSEQYLDILEATGPDGKERQRLNEAKEKLDQANAGLNELRQSIAVCKGRGEEIGTREQLEQRRQQLEDEHADILWNLDAIEHAKQALIRVNAELTGRMAPQINQLAQKYLQTLTANKYAALQLYTNFEAVCRQENSAVELDRLRLSAGTRDQLYFALRLAACIVLLDTRMEKVPLIMDDPFLTYDEERSACAMSLLRELAYERQIILLTCRKPIS